MSMRFGVQLIGTADGSNCAFTFPSAPTFGTVAVYVDGKRLYPGADYQHAGTAIYFAAAPPSRRPPIADYDEGSWTGTAPGAESVTATSHTSGGGAPTAAQYVTLATDATLSAERVLTAGTAIGLTDGGAGGAVTLAVQLGTSGTTACAGNDSRLSDARTPTGSASGDLTGTYPAPTLAAIGSAAGPIGSSSVTPVITIDAKGRVTALTSAAITASVTATTVEVNLGSSLVWRGKFTITDAGITSSKKVLCWQAPGPYTGKGTRADEADLQPVRVVAVEPASGSATVYWETPPVIARPWKRLNTVGGSAALLLGSPWAWQPEAIRINRVRGNVKFSYAIFS